MKNTTLSPLYFISNPLRIVKDEISAVSQSPYLKAMLSGKTSARSEGNGPVENSDRAAASRYIRDSKMLRRKSS